MQVGATRVPLTEGSMFGGPNIAGATAWTARFFSESPDGSINGAWDSNSVSLFAGQVQTRSTGGTALLLPMQLSGSSTREIIKRRTPSDPQVVRDSRYHSKAQIRILIDDENPGTLTTREYQLVRDNYCRDLILFLCLTQTKQPEAAGPCGECPTLEVQPTPTLLVLVSFRITAALLPRR